MADTLDVCILTDVKLALGIDLDNQMHDVELADQITAISRMLDKRCGAIVQRTVTSEELSTAGAHEDSPYGIKVFNFGFPPVVSVSTLTEYVGTSSTVLTEQTPGTAPAEGYRLDRRTGMARRLIGGRPSVFPSYSTLVATYVAGRYATTATVDERFARAGVITVVEQWKANKGMGTVTFGAAVQEVVLSGSTGLPRDAWTLIKDDLRLGGVA